MLSLNFDIFDPGTDGSTLWRQKMKAIARLRLAFGLC